MSKTSQSIENLQQTEPSPDLKEKILLPYELDAKIDSGFIDKNKLLVSTTMPLPRFLDDSKNINMNTIQWIQRVPEESDFFEKKNGPFRRKKVTKSRDPKKWLKENREYFGWQAGIRDVLISNYPEAANQIFNSDYAYFLYLGREYASGHPLDTMQDLENLIGRANSYGNINLQREIAHQQANRLIRILNGFETAREVIEEASKRRGVQVIYGGNDFANYFKKATRANIGSDIPYSESMAERIPLKLATAIVPIGEYEIAKLTTNKPLEISL